MALLRFFAIIPADPLQSASKGQFSHCPALGPAVASGIRRHENHGGSGQK
jgi:hypothetical protein